MVDISLKDQFLQSLASKGKNRYKRYTKSPIRYAGGKSLAVGHIIEHFPSNINKMVSPFIGGGSVEIATANELQIPVKAFDVFDILVNYWNVQVMNPHGLGYALWKMNPTPDTYNNVKERLKAHWKNESKITDHLDLAVHYWFNHNLSYGPGFLGWMSKIYEDRNRYERMVQKVIDFQCSNLEVWCAEFQHVIPSAKGDFLYCDPPYYLEGDSKMFKGIYPQRNFPVHHNNFNHAYLNELLKKHEGGFVLSYNDCETIREIYKDFDIVEVQWQYTMGQGETRIGKNRIENGTKSNIKQSHEILIIG